MSPQTALSVAAPAATSGHKGPALVARLLRLVFRRPRTPPVERAPLAPEAKALIANLTAMR